MQTRSIEAASLLATSFYFLRITSVYYNNVGSKQMKKEFALVTVTAVTTLLLLVGCGVKVTNISVQ